MAAPEVFAKVETEARGLWDVLPTLRYAFPDFNAFRQTRLITALNDDTGKERRDAHILEMCDAGAERLALVRDPLYAEPQTDIVGVSGGCITVWLYGFLGEPTRSGACAHTAIVSAIDEHLDASCLLFRISSTGGMVDSLKEVVAAIKRFRGRTVAIIDHFAISSAADLAMVCDRVVMRSNAVFMLHRSHKTVTGDYLSLASASNQLRETDEYFERQLLQSRRVTDSKRVLEVMAAGNYYMGAAEALSLGLCDAITRPLCGSDSVISRGLPPWQGT